MPVSKVWLNCADIHRTPHSVNCYRCHVYQMLCSFLKGICGDVLYQI